MLMVSVQCYPVAWEARKNCVTKVPSEIWLTQFHPLHQIPSENQEVRHGNIGNVEQ